jgi:hypothetical protein
MQYCLSPHTWRFITLQQHLCADGYIAVGLHCRIDFLDAESYRLTNVRVDRKSLNVEDLVVICVKYGVAYEQHC